MQERLDKMFDLLLEINDRTIKNTATLEEHERRSTMSEKRLEVQEAKLEHFMDETSEKIGPIARHVDRVSFAIKAIIVITGLIGTIVGILKYIID